MNYKLLIYAFMLIATVFAMTGINYTGFFRTNHKTEAKLFVILVAMAISYLASQFVLSFIE
ncbi:MAG: DUF1146 domain-containing protein [Bacilli bacterium]|nr:DUF1146 domain-containing protein [Bacilli bacterium]